jgi:hypothetical protein
MIIFDTNSIGRLVMLNGPKIVGSVNRTKLLSISRDAEANRLGEDISGFKAIFTSVNFNEGANVQFQHTLGDTIYLNVFGNRISQLKVSGIAVSGFCDAGANAVNDGEHGISRVIQYYRESRVSSRRDPLIISIASSGKEAAYQGYLVGMQGGMFGEMHTTHRMFQFGLDFVIPPK